MEQPPNDDIVVIVSSDDDELKVSMEQQPREEQLLDYDGWKIREKQPGEEQLLDYDEWKIKEKQLKKLKQIFSRRLADLGGDPMPTGIMVLSKSFARRWVNPLLLELVVGDWFIDDLQDYLNKQSNRVSSFMMAVIMVVIVVSICNPSYASSLGVWFWFYCIYILRTTYMFWLNYKMELVEKYRVSIAEWALELRKELPDQCDEYLINMVCSGATKNSDIGIGYDVLLGSIVLCGKYYWNAL